MKFFWALQAEKKLQQSICEIRETKKIHQTHGKHRKRLQINDDLDDNFRKTGIILQRKQILAEDFISYKLVVPDKNSSEKNQKGFDDVGACSKLRSFPFSVIEFHA